MAELERVCGVPHDATAEFTERRRERFDYKETKRVAVRIVVAPGMSREELARTMRVALVRSYRTELNSLGSVGAIDVLAYASDAVDGAFSAARGTLAPEGDWSKASETVPLSEWSVRIEYAEGYFAAKHAQAVPGDTLVILGEAGDQIALSREPARWNDQDIVTRVAPGTKVQVIAVKAFPMAGGRELMRLKVKTIGAAPRTGWVHASATSRPLTDG